MPRKSVPEAGGRVNQMNGWTKGDTRPKQMVEAESNVLRKR